MLTWGSLKWSQHLSGDCSNSGAKSRRGLWTEGKGLCWLPSVQGGSQLWEEKIK